MSPEAQRIAIAEACGWRLLTKPQQFGNVFLGAGCWWQDDQQRGGSCPDYLSDLNAMREAEEALAVQQQNIMLRITIDHIGVDRAMFATAAQRAEAFLRTIGKWEDAE